MAKVIINEFLTFVQNKIDVLDEVSIIKICSDNYSDTDIETGKNVLFNSCGDGIKIVHRKGDDKKKKNIKDVIKVLKEIVDPDLQPTFVAKDLNRLPPITFDYVDVTRLLKDMTVMRSELTNFQTKISSELLDLRSSFDSQLNEKNKSYVVTTPKRTEIHHPLPPMSGAAPDHATTSSGVRDPHTPMYRDIVVSRKKRNANNDLSRNVRTGEDGMNTTCVQPTITSLSSMSLPPGINDEDGLFTMVQRKKRKIKAVNMRGTLETSGRIQVAESQCSIYVSRTKKCVTEADILQHVRDMGEQCISVELLKQNYETTFNSFKVVIVSSKLKIFLDTSFWPAGLVYRRYRERHVRTVASNKPV